MGKGVSLPLLLDILKAHGFFSLRIVHGSLARAGKVKSQTPKVEAQEKKKVPKGRAKKRILYNRRYVLSTRHNVHSAHSWALDLSTSLPYSRVENGECEFGLLDLGLFPRTFPRPAK